MINLALTIASFAGAGASSTIPITANLLAWWRSDLGVTTASGLVSQWNDSSGSGDSNRNFTQGTSADRPTYNTADSNYNGRPSISASATGPWLATGSWSTGAIAQPFSIVVFGNVLAADEASLSNPFTDGIGASNRAVLYTIPGTPPTPRIFAGNEQDAATSYPVASPAAFAAVFNGSSSALYVNTSGNGNVLSAGSSGAESLTGLTLMSFFNQSAFFAGTIVEVAVYSTALSQANVGTLFAYGGKLYQKTWS